MHRLYLKCSTSNCDLVHDVLSRVGRVGNSVCTLMRMLTLKHGACNFHLYFCRLWKDLEVKFYLEYCDVNKSGLKKIRVADQKLWDPQFGVFHG
jgi:hypothetical protein